MDGLIILDGTGRPIIQSNFRNHPPSYAMTHVDAFNDALSKVESRGDGLPADLDPVLYVSGTQPNPSVCCHVETGGLRILCPASRDVDPLFIFAFLRSFISTLEDYLQEVSISTLKDNFDVVYQLLEEMLDDGHPLTTESNALRDIVLPPSFFNKILSVAGVSGLSAATPTPFSSPIPWRKTGLRYNNNEIYIDISEDLEAIISRNETLLSSDIWGRMKCNCHMSGTPDLTVSFANPKVITDPSFHPSVRLQKFAQTSSLSFVPPDGNFVLMEYRVSPSAPSIIKTSAVGSSSQPQLQLVPLVLKPSIELTEKGGSIHLSLTPRSQSYLRGRPLEQVVISLYLGDGATGASCTVSHSGGGVGSGGIRDREREEKTAGSWAWEPKEKTLCWAIPNLIASSSSASWNLKGSFTSSDLIPRPSRAISMTFRSASILYSGLKVDQLKLSGEGYKPYKGVRTSIGGSVEWRW